MASSEVPLSEISALREMSREQAAQRLPMRIRGVITYYEPQRFMTFIQDSTGGTYLRAEWKIVDPPGMNPSSLGPGIEIEATGVTDGGRFAPFLDSVAPNTDLEVKVIGPAKLPQPLRPVRGELLDPKFHSQWVEVEAFARAVQIARNRLTISLVFGGRRFDAHVPGKWEGKELPKLVNSDLRLRGVFGSNFNEQRQLIGMQLCVPSLDQIEVLDASLERAFRQPLRAVREIMQFNPGVTERMRVQGTVTFTEPGRGYYLRDASGAVWVDSPETLAVGTVAEIVGFAAIDGQVPVLRDAVARVSGVGPAPEPLPVDGNFALDPALHGQLVRVEGKVADRLSLPQHQSLVVQSGDTLFHARFARPGDNAQLPEVGAWVQATGIWQNVTRGGSVLSENASVAQILMRSLADLSVLKTAPWWTPQRLTILAVSLGCVVAAALAWAITLRRRVEKQSAVIAAKISSEHVAEERTRIARELHDTLEQHLAGVTIQLEAAASRLPEDPAAAERALTVGAAMLRHSRSEARRSVWDLRSQLLEQHGLPHALRDLANSSDGPEVSVCIEGSERRMDPQVEFHLLRIAQEALTNARKHAKARKIEMRVIFRETSVSLVVIDDGVGFDPAVNGAAPRFGLLGMRERAGKIRGILTVESASGTTVRIDVPTTA